MFKHYHPDILKAHAEFGGDLDAMQAMYDRPAHLKMIGELEKALSGAVLVSLQQTAELQKLRTSHYLEMTALKNEMEDMRAAFMEAVDFTADEAGLEASTFMKVWREGGTTKEADALNEWEDFRNWCAARKAKGY